MVGVLAEIARVLKDAEISIFTISTWYVHCGWAGLGWAGLGCGLGWAGGAHQKQLEVANRQGYGLHPRDE